jgi:hypothetical protein
MRSGCRVPRAAKDTAPIRFEHWQQRRRSRTHHEAHVIQLARPAARVVIGQPVLHFFFQQAREQLTDAEPHRLRVGGQAEGDNQRSEVCPAGTAEVVDQAAQAAVGLMARLLGKREQTASEGQHVAGGVRAVSVCGVDGADITRQRRARRRAHRGDVFRNETSHRGLEIFRLLRSILLPLGLDGSEVSPAERRRALCSATRCAHALALERASASRVAAHMSATLPMRSTSASCTSTTGCRSIAAMVMARSGGDATSGPTSSAAWSDHSAIAAVTRRLMLRPNTWSASGPDTALEVALAQAAFPPPLPVGGRKLPPAAAALGLDFGGILERVACYSNAGVTTQRIIRC